MSNSVSVKDFQPALSIKNGNIIDVGLKVPGSWSAGKKLIKLFIGGMGYVNYGVMPLKGISIPTVDTFLDNPAKVCLTSMINEKKIEKYTMLGPDSWGENNFCYFETEEIPSDLSQKTEQTIIVSSALSLVSAIYNSALLVPLAVKKLVSLGLSLEQINWAWGSCPLATLSEHYDLLAKRKHDVLEYGGVTSVWIRGEDNIMQEITNMWEGLGEIRLHNLVTAKTFVGGEINEIKLEEVLL